MEINQSLATTWGELIQEIWLNLNKSSQLHGYFNLCQSHPLLSSSAVALTNSGLISQSHWEKNLQRLIFKQLLLLDLSGSYLEEPIYRIDWCSLSA